MCVHAIFGSKILGISQDYDGSHMEDDTEFIVIAFRRWVRYEFSEYINIEFFFFLKKTRDEKRDRNNNV